MRNIAMIVALALGATLAAPAGAQTVPALIPTGTLAEPSLFEGPKLSPDGTKLLAQMSSNGTTALAVADLAGSGLEQLALPDQNELISYSWAGNGRVIVVMGRKMQWYDKGERYVTRAFMYDLASGKTLWIGPKVMGIDGSEIMWVDPAGKSLLMSAQADQYSYPSVYRIDLDSGKAKLEQGPYDNIWDWTADKDGEIRMGIGYTELGWFVKYRKSGKDGYSESPTVSWNNGDPSRALRMISGSDDGYALSDKNGRMALYHYNFATRTYGSMIYGNDTNDIDDVGFDEKTGQPILVTYTDDRDRLAWLDPARKATQANLDKTFAGRSVVTVSRSRDTNRSVLWVGSNTDPGSYYLLDGDTGAIKRLAKVADKIDRTALAETKYVHYKSRDGLDIPAYLTLPKGRDPKNLPLIIVPHGGPYGVRDSLNYDNEVQFLANRGYAVLQPNYRGSSGYGTAFTDRGKGQWGRAMQDDIDDGMDWLTKQGIVDAKRVCIVGGSYGGYVALWGATRNPERYRCAVSFAGISDLKAQLNYQSDFLIARSGRKDWQSRVRGDKDFDLLTVSPISKVASLKVPIMLVHGDADATVPLKQTTLYDKALSAAGKVHETYIYPGAGHGFKKAADEKSYLDRLEAFLAKYNPS